MLEVLEFVFQSFWTWLGTLLLVGAASLSVGRSIRTLSGKD